MQNMPLPEATVLRKLRQWLAQADGEGKIVLRRQNGAVIRADFSRVVRIQLHDRDGAPEAIMQAVRGFNPEYGSVVIHDRREVIEVEISESVVNVGGPQLNKTSAYSPFWAR